MKRLRWQDHQECFETVLACIECKLPENTFDISPALKNCTNKDPSSEQMILGVSASSISFLEYLFHKAEGPYSPNFERTAKIIALFCKNEQGIQNLLNLNASDALANMVLNKRGKLKLLISDKIELGIILEWWLRFGLTPISPREVFEAILAKSTIRERISNGDPPLILRLLDVFPEYTKEINPNRIPQEELIKKAGTITKPPSERRYHRLYESYQNAGKNIWSVIEEEEKRILPMQMKRNKFLAYLVRNLHNKCQICTLEGKETDESLEVHHIIPLSQQGKDIADNMLVTCVSHHKAIHEGVIKLIPERDQVQIITSDGDRAIPYNSEIYSYGTSTQIPQD